MTNNTMKFYNSLLDMADENKEIRGVSQSEIAELLGLSLGQTHYYLAQLEKEGHIKIDRQSAPRVYYLTPKKEPKPRPHTPQEQEWDDVMNHVEELIADGRKWRKLMDFINRLKGE